MQNLLIPRRRRDSSAPRRFITTLSNAFRSAALVLDQAPVEAPAADPTDVYAADELPAADLIEAAAAEFDRAADQGRRADRGKRAARKILDRLPAGQYGGWLVYRLPSSRQTADLDAIRATYKQLGLGPVPMKDSAPSLKVARAEMPAEVTA